MGLGASGAQRRQTLASTIIVLHTANACVPRKLLIGLVSGQVSNAFDIPGECMACRGMSWAA
jgi:hypothetical protein